MPDANGRFRPIAVPQVPWCRTCKLVACVCPPAHPSCGTADCCGTCPTAAPGPIDRRAPHRFATPVVVERRSARRVC